MKHFIFLYPIPEIINWEIENNEWRFPKGEFRKAYQRKLNDCIDLRYRKKGYNINYALFDDTWVSEIIELRKGDREIRVGLDFKTHTTKQPDGSFIYPENNFILSQIEETDHLVITGFHIWDCVEKLAKKAYENGLNVLVDEDLTEFFTFKIISGEKFLLDKFPSSNPRERGERFFEAFIEGRRNKPWLWQEY